MEPTSFFEKLIGTTDISTWASGFLLALMAAFIVFRLNIHKRDKRSTSTPVKFSWQFALMDNAMRILTTACLIFIGLRFTKEIFGLDISVYSAVVVGVGCDSIALFLKNLGLKARK